MPGRTEAARTTENPGVSGRQVTFRRSFVPRGARPHTAATQATPADALGSTPEADELRAIVAVTARELGLTWLLPPS